MGCARCHDHKYDPITQRDFYRFFAFFNNVPERRASTDSSGNAEPYLQTARAGAGSASRGRTSKSGEKCARSDPSADERRDDAAAPHGGWAQTSPPPLGRDPRTVCGLARPIEVQARESVVPDRTLDVDSAGAPHARSRHYELTGSRSSPSCRVIERTPDGSR